MNAQWRGLFDFAINDFALGDFTIRDGKMGDRARARCR